MIEIILRMQTTTPVHVGGEVRQKTTATRPMLKTSDGLPYIPATSVKGRLRHATEAFLRSQDVFVCNAPAPERMCQSLTDDAHGYCAVCRLFGSPWREATLHFNPLCLSPEDTKSFAGDIPATTNRAGIRINRKRRSVQEHFLFDTELFEPGYPWSFIGTARYSGDDPVEITPVLLAAGMVNMIGGNRSRGLGWGELSLTPKIEDVPTLDVLWGEWRGRYG